MGRLAKKNNILLILIILVNCYVIVTPLIPAIAFRAPGRAAAQQSLAKKIDASAPPPAPAEPNSLVIPAMLLDQPVLEGRDTYKILNQGILRWPGSSTPDQGSNTVLLGHRFTYGNPRGAFYHLDKLQIGDNIGITWNHKRYLYTVTQMKVAKPTDVGILAPSDKPRLTLFTCTPLLWPKDRLVIIAEGVKP